MENNNITFFDTFGAAYDHIETELYVDEEDRVHCEPELCHPLGYILFPHIHLDIMQKIKLAKHSNTLSEFMEVFDVDSLKTLSDYFGDSIEDILHLLENNEIFMRMKKILTYIMVCNAAWSHRLYRYESYDEVNSFLRKTKKFYKNCEKFFEVESLL